MMKTLHYLLGMVCFCLLSCSPFALKQKIQNRAYSKQPPKPGQTLPEMDIYDEAGQPFALSKLRGQTTVLILGCLT